MADLGTAPCEPQTIGGARVTRLEQLRLDALLTPEQLGEKTGVAGNTIRRLEAGKSARVSTLARLSTYFAVSASELLREVGSDSKAAA